MAKAGQTQFFNRPMEEGMGFSAIVNARGVLHLAGVIAIDEQGAVVSPGDMAGQVSRIYDIIEQTLALNGATLEHVVNEVMYTTDMAALMEVTPVRRERYESYAFPAATAVQVVALAFPEAMLEIQVTAQLDGDEWSSDIEPLGSPA